MCIEDICLSMNSICTKKKTLDIYHNNNLEQFKQAKREIREMEGELKIVCDKIFEFELISNSNLSDQEFQAKINLIDQKINIENALKSRRAEMDDTNYFINTSPILFEYYDLIEKGNTNQLIIDHDTYKNTESILRFFTSTPIPETQQTTNKERTRGSLLENYMSIIDKNYINDKKKNLEEVCKHCKSVNITTMTNDGYLVCNDCHTMEYMLVDHDKPSYKDPPKEITYFSYKRINHLNEWLNQIQGKETTEIPEEIYDQILMEIKKQRITNMADLSYDKVKRILKQLKVHKYYEHIPHIINRLNGLPMPNFSQDLEEKLRTMFKQIQTPFLKHSPPNRKNFLSYSYVLHKFLQLLEKDEYLIFFQLLKSRDKLAGQDKIWKKICEEVGWQFIPSL